ncbi:MAG TPA: hypothetical protein VNK91_01955 [Burkholderiaceae bacterium]|nr:hypothetical protein [Burkholderiaceae bacterium]
MPRVPIAERQIQPTGQAGARLDVRAPALTGIGQGLGTVAEVAERIAEAEKRKGDQLAVLEADRRLGGIETQLLYDPAQGALTKRGKDAFAAPESVLQTFDEQVGEIERGLTNDAQRLAFRRTATMRRLTIDRALQQHVAAEIRAYDSAETNAYLANEIDAGIAAAGDAERIELAIGRTRAAIVDHARRNGLPPEWQQQKIAATASQIRAGVVERLLAAGSDRAAKSYYETHQAEILGGERAKLEKALEVGSLRGESQRQADAILLEHGELASAVEAARQIKDPEIRDAVTTRVKDYFTTRRAAEEEKRARTFRAAAQALERSGGDLRVVTPADWVTLDPGERRALEIRSRQIREGVEPVTNWDRYYGLLSIASDEATRAQFLRLDLMQYRHELSDTEFKDLAGKQAALRQGKQIDEALDGYRTKKQIVDDALNAIGIDPTPKDGTKDARRVNEFRRQVDGHILDLQARTGKKATTKEVQEIVDTLLIKGRIPGSGYIWDTRKRLYELAPGEAFDVDVDEIPRAERQKIEEALRRGNRPVTPAAIVELFKLKHVRESAP